MNQANNEEEQSGNNIKEAERIKLPREKFTEEDQDLKAMFIIQLENLTHSSLLQMEPREKLLKALFHHFNTIPEICDKVHAMGRATGFKLGKLVEDNEGDRKKKSANGGNKQEQKLKKEIKELRQIVVETSNKLYRRRQRRKVTKKEKEIIKELRVLTEKDTTNYNMRNAKEQWLDKSKYKKIKLANCGRKKTGEGSKTISCFCKTRRHSSECWKERRHMKERCLKWKTLSSFEEVFGKEKEEHQTRHGWKR